MSADARAAAVTTNRAGLEVALPFVLQFLVGAVAASIGAFDPIEDGQEFFTLRFGIVGLLSYAAGIAATIWVARRHGRVAPLLGLRGLPVGRAIGLTIAAFVLTLVANGLLEPIFHGAEEQGLEPDPFPGGTRAGVALALSALAVCLVGPVGEELFFRGLLYGSLRRWGRPLAVVASAAIFAGVHFVPAALPVLFIVGVILALLYERTGSLIPSIALHVLINTLAFTAGLLAP